MKRRPAPSAFFARVFQNSAKIVAHRLAAKTVDRLRMPSRSNELPPC